MKITIDTDQHSLHLHDKEQQLPLYSTAAFETLSALWLKVGWNQKYVYTFSWMGRPIIQLPEDLIRVQEVIYRLRPDVIVETGVAHGGSLIFYAGLLRAMGLTHSRVVGVDLEIRPHNRQALEQHELYPAITLIEGNSTAPAVVAQVRACVPPDATTLVLLDSNHSYTHVSAELEAYHTLVSPNSYIVATDGIMQDLADVPRGQPDWTHDNPSRAALDFLQLHPEFVIEQPAWPFNESQLTQNVTHWPSAWLRRLPVPTF
jgi:cephalosporin hydroxylase